jgi:secondary thiamine-phosphate synthase enzyme
MENWHQSSITLKAKPRGFHLITREIISQTPEITQFKIGKAHIFLQHTSASITINENADPDVRDDFESHFNKYVPENAPYYIHTCEGPDDMPAHLKSSILGNELTIPITNGQLNMGVWQGIYLCEHRNWASGRKIIVTLNGIY